MPTPTTPPALSLTWIAGIVSSNCTSPTKIWSILMLHSLSGERTASLLLHTVLLNTHRHTHTQALYNTDIDRHLLWSYMHVNIQPYTVNVHIFKDSSWKTPGVESNSYTWRNIDPVPTGECSGGGGVATGTNVSMIMKAQVQRLHHKDALDICCSVKNVPEPGVEFLK